jgi:RNA polymerase sigma-70 factor (ECF subfamily)
MTPEQEREYIQQAQRNPSAFVHLYDHYFPRVHAFVCYRVYNLQDAEDIIADAFVKAIRNLKRFKWRRGGSFTAWLFRIVHNLIVDYYRQGNRVTLSPVSDDSLATPVSQGTLPEEALAQQEAFRQIRALIVTLSPRRQEVITLRFYGGLRNGEIAEVLGLDERTVSSHLSRGLQDLKRRYAAQTQSKVLMEVTA